MTDIRSKLTDEDIDTLIDAVIFVDYSDPQRPVMTPELYEKAIAIINRIEEEEDDRYTK